eukprot:6801838-Prymnesium_polylepis.1
MDHAEEQAMELEALEAIYMEDYTRLEGVEPPSFELKLVPETGAGDDVNHVSIVLCVVYKPTYPEVPPELTVRPVRGLDDTQVDELKNVVVEASQSEELVGTAMVYAIVERAQEWLVQHNMPEQDLHAQMMARLQEGGSSAAADDADGADDGRSSASQQSLREKAKASRKAGGIPSDDWRADPANAAAAATQTPVTPETFAVWRAAQEEK